MARCEDYPCCGHEAGCCPDYDDSGRQLNMKCVCGATVPLGSSTSLCPDCLHGARFADDGNAMIDDGDDCPDCGGELDGYFNCMECDN